MHRLGWALLCVGITSLGPRSPAMPEEPAAPRKTVAVLYFDNYTGSADYDPLGRGLASMMISDLSSVQQIQLVERDRLQDLVKEMEMQQTKYFDSTTAVKVGHLAGAEYVITGALAAAQPNIRIDTRVIRVETGEIVKTARVTGHEDKFFDLEQKLAKQLIDGLAIALSPEEQEKLRAQQEANRIDELKTMVSFSQAMAMSDRGDYVGAAEKMGPVLRDAPNSLLVRMTYDEMKQRAAGKARQKATDKVKEGVGRFFKKKP
jgi:TolB-like protein